MFLATVSGVQTGSGNKFLSVKEKIMHLADQTGNQERKMEQSPRLGALLLNAGDISEEALRVALSHQKTTGRRLGETLIELNIISEETMRRGLCAQMNVPFIHAGDIHVEPGLSRVINRTYAQRHLIVPIARSERTLTLIVDDPTDRQLMDELRGMTGFTFNVVSSTRADLLTVFRTVYEETPSSEAISTVRLLDDGDRESLVFSKNYDTYQLRKADALVTQLIRIALKKSSSDIHIESIDRQLDIRFRIDGVLQKIYLGKLEDDLNRLRREVISRIKVLGNLDIAEKRRPQDGSFRARFLRGEQEVKIDFRISIVLGYYGENVVLRVLDGSKAPRSIDELGFTTRITQTLHGLLKKNTGILLVTGPTGSGKSTTLYGALMTCYRPGIKILTAEDPIEYVYDKITQCEINPKIGNTFAAYIRAFLRQDPEVIMVGEIRDAETAEMAFRAAQTGHLVLSTLHTNDAVSSITRLLDFNVDPSLIASCLLGVLSQRLVRQVCEHCKREYQPPKEVLNEFFDVSPEWLKSCRGEGCSHCNHTGYNGRMAVAELWTPSDHDIILISKRKGIEALRRSSYQSTIFMAEDALEKLQAGLTNPEELIRTLPFSSIMQFRRTANMQTRVPLHDKSCAQTDHWRLDGNPWIGPSGATF